MSRGQKLNYKVEYENEGGGTAYGVYVTDVLDEDLDDSTLEIGPLSALGMGQSLLLPEYTTPKPGQ